MRDNAERLGGDNLEFARATDFFLTALLLSWACILWSSGNECVLGYYGWSRVGYVKLYWATFQDITFGLSFMYNLGHNVYPS